MYAYCSREIFEWFWLSVSYESMGGQGRNRTADAGLFRAAYRIAEAGFKSTDLTRIKNLSDRALGLRPSSLFIVTRNNAR